MNDLVHKDTAATKQPAATIVQRLDRMSRHRLLPFLGWLIAIGVAITLYVAGDHKPELTYFVHPAKAVVVRSGQSSGLEVTFGGLRLTTDVTAAQIAFWNNGSRAIHKDDVLKPMRIVTLPSVRILEASIRKTSRDVVHLELDPSRANYGEILVRWNVLEKNDGGVIQLVFAGGEKVMVAADATIEGQVRVIGQRYDAHVESPGEAYAKARSQRWVDFLFVLLLAGQTAIVIYRGVGHLKRRAWMSMCGSLAFLGMSVFLIVRELLNWVPTPPFGF